MELKSFYVTDSDGNIVANATVTVYEQDGVTVAAIYDESGAPKPNPFSAGSNGWASFRAATGSYEAYAIIDDLGNTAPIYLTFMSPEEFDPAGAADAAYEAARQRSNQTGTQPASTISDPENFELPASVITDPDYFSVTTPQGAQELSSALGNLYNSRVQFVTSVAEMSALDVGEGHVATVPINGQQSQFELKAGDFTDYIDTDPLGAVYVPSSVFDTNTACWVRQYNGSLEVQWFGADASGYSDPGPAFRAMFALGKLLGTKTYILQDGARYNFTSPDPSDASEARAVYVTGLSSDIFIVGKGATLAGYNSIRSASAQSSDAPGTILRLELDDEHMLTIGGLRTDLSNVTRAEAGVPTIGAVDVVGAYVYTMDDCFWDHGYTTPTSANPVGAGGGDQSLFLSSCPGGVIGGHFRGAPDLGVYISAIGSVDIKITAQFTQCLNAVGLKRLSGRLTLDNVRTYKCKRVVYTPTASGSSTNNGRQIIVNGGFFKYTEEWVVDASGNSAGSICTGAVIEDFGRRIYDGGPLTGTGDYISAIRMRAPHCQVYGNIIRMVDWPPTGSGSNMSHLGIELAHDGNNGVGADYSQAYGNNISGIPYGIRIAANVTGAREWGNEVSEVTNTALVDEGTNSRGLCSQVTYQFTSGAPANVYITTAGDLQRTTSARKYKTDEQPLDDETYQAALKLEPKTYLSLSPSDDPQFRFLGFIADEADDLGLEPLVVYGGKGEVEGFAYERMSVIHQRAIQELMTRVAELEAKLANS